MNNKICSLRRSIYDMAIKGKLVKQLNNEKPFELNNLKSKNDSLIICKDGKYFDVKKNKTIQIEEVPFDLPTGWKFARLSSLYELYTGDSIPQAVKNNKYVNLNKKDSLPYIATKDVGFDHVINYENGIRIPQKELEKFRLAKNGTLLFCIEGGSAGRKIAILKQDVCFGNKLMCFNPKYIEMPIIYYFLQSPTFASAFNESLTGLITGISKKNLENLLIPVPPIEEQKRIVDRLKLLDPLIDEYEKLERERSNLDATIIAQLKKAILKSAIQGSLTKQNLNDLSALDLFKKAKCKENVTTDEPFDLPKNWKLCYLGDLIELISGRDIDSSLYNSNKKGIPYLTGASNIKDNGDFLINRWTTAPAVISSKGDLLITCKGTIGTLTFNNYGEVHIARQLMAVRTKLINPRYIMYFLQSYVTTLQNNANSIIPGISRKDILSAPFPLPPIEEQKRIVEKVDEMMSAINIF